MPHHFTKRSRGAPGVSSQWRALARVAERAEVRLRAVIMDALRASLAALPQRRLRGAVAARDAVGVANILARAYAPLRGAQSPIAKILLDAHTEGGQVALAHLPRRYTVKSLELVFDGLNPEAVAWAREHAMETIVALGGLTPGVLESLAPWVLQRIRQEILEAFTERRTAAEAARRIVDAMAMDPQYATAIANFRDGLVARGGLTQRQIEWRVQRYKNRLLRQRANRITRTEAVAASNRGQVALWRQAIADGFLPPGSEMIWIVTPDDRLCPYCAPMAGNVVGVTSGNRYSSTITTPTGLVRSLSAETPPLHPQCRCALVLRVDGVPLSVPRPTDGRPRLV